MIEKLLNFLDEEKKKGRTFDDILVEKNVPPKTILLREGEVANRVYFVKKGCLREWFNKDGKEITFQFFFEGQPVSSIDSFMWGTPSMFTIESLEHSTLVSVKKDDLFKNLEIYPDIKDIFMNFIFKRFSNYEKLFLSRIKDTPQERYQDLLENHSNILQRIPQHYIASYLGITPISLSRIRNRKT